ncbi:MAG: response regulator transcription factor [Thermoanaerobaculia bacterium]|nr:response regulator transcription factor [Thermoanaerobaculia bacterium]
MSSSPPRTIAVVDDEENLRSTVAFALERAGWPVVTYADGLSAWEAFGRRLPDLVILDILMPKMDGLELCRRLRSKSETLPIVFLTSKDEELDRVLGLELGADDYLCKPFSMRELVARVKVLFRRLSLAVGGGEDAAPALHTAGSLTLDLHRYQARWNGAPLVLTVTEYRLLHALARHPGHVKTRGQLMDEAYPDDAYLAERTIDSHIKRLRKKLDEARGSGPDPIETVYGLGYRFRLDE